MKNNDAKKNILEATLRVVDKHTINGTRMHLIAQEAGVAQSTLHYYYKTKRELLVSLLQMVQEDFIAKRSTLFAGAKQSLDEQINCYFSQKKDIIHNEKRYDHAQFEFWCQGQIDPVINNKFFEFYVVWRDGISRTITKYAPQIPAHKVRMASHVMVSMMMGASMQYLNAEASFDLDEYFEACLSMVLFYLDE